LSRIRKFALAGACAASVVAAVPATAPAAKRDVKVMTRNLYLGADIIRLASAQTREELATNTSAMYQTILNNNFAVRAKALAREIDRANPQLIGLQEVSLFRRTPDGQQNDSELNATEPLIDHLKLLQQELKARGLQYKAASVIPNTDLEAPVAEGYELRLTNRDVVLVKQGVKVDKKLGGKFDSKLTVPIATGPVEVTRGWAGADVRIKGRKVRFVTAHAEAYSPQNARDQLQEVLDGPLANKRRQSILVGDFNSDPADEDPSAFRAVTRAGFKNAIPKRLQTSPTIEDLREEQNAWDTWIDHIMVRPKIKTVKYAVTGTKPSDRLEGLWPSDHAGVWATLRLPKKKG